MTIEAHFSRIFEYTPAFIRPEVVGISTQEPRLSQIVEQQQYALPPENLNSPEVNI